jgi:uncharacterized protein YbbC (DUF1343 family)
MSTGLDSVAAGFVPQLKGKRVALLTNHTAVEAWGRHAVQVLTAQGVHIVRLLAPEHGPWGIAQDMEPVEGGLDPVFGLPVISLYGTALSSLTPNPQALADIDVLVYDIQDIGTRYYTYAATLALAMQVAAPLGVPVMVLDRPNPIGPRREGPLLTPGYESFCGLVAGLPIRHGMTIGELAMWYRHRLAPTCELTVIPCQKASRLPFSPTSPNMPTRDTALVYPGLCLFEGTTISEGRGTTSPFLQVGCPGLDSLSVVERMRKKDCPGVDVVPVRFRPAFGKYAGQIVDGVYLRVYDDTALQAVKLGVYLLDAIKREAPARFAWRTDAYEFVTDKPAIDLLWGSSALRECLDESGDVDALLEKADAEVSKWKPTW